MLRASLVETESTATVPERAICVLTGAAAPEILCETRNADGGWGLTGNHHSDLVDTLIAANALLLLGAGPPEGWQTTVDWLLQVRSAGGGWHVAGNSENDNLRLTARALIALQDLSDTLPVPSLRSERAVADAADLLRSKLTVNAEEAPSSALLDLITTAMVFRALLRTDPPGLYDSVLNTLIAGQREDGSWAADNVSTSYATAIVGKTLLAVPVPDARPRPDLLVRPEAISLQPPHPAATDTARLTVRVFNRGNAAASNATVGLSVLAPAAFSGQFEPRQITEPLAAGASATVAWNVDISTFHAQPRLSIVANPDCSVAESDFGNNRALFEPSVAGLPPPGDPSPCNVAVEALTLNGQSTDEVQPTASPTVMLGAVIRGRNLDVPADVVLVMEADGKAVARTVTRVAAPHGVSDVRLPWNPSQGEHTVTVRVEPGETCADNNLGDNILTRQVRVAGNDHGVRLERMVDGMLLSPPLRAYDRTLITVTGNDRPTRPDLWIARENGELISPRPVPTNAPGIYEWNSRNVPPGTYRATVSFRDPRTNGVVDTASRAFEIHPARSLRSITVLPNRSTVEAGTAEQVPVSVILASGSNVDAAWNLCWTLRSPEDDILASSSEQQVTLLADQRSLTVADLPPVEIPKTASGMLAIVVEARLAAEAGVSMSGSATISVLPALRIAVHNEVRPSEISPLGAARATAILRVSALDADASSALPVTVTGVTLDSAGSLPDDSGAQTTVRLSGVLNARGQPVSDGTAVLIYAPYGNVVGTESVPESADHPGLCLSRTRGGDAVFQFVPEGAALTANRFSVAPVRFHQYLPDTVRWFGKRIGSMEVLLKGQ